MLTYEVRPDGDLMSVSVPSPALLLLYSALLAALEVRPDNVLMSVSSCFTYADVCRRMLYVC
jgi:hypothetical protein